jgi:hypothetical protein
MHKKTFRNFHFQGLKLSSHVTFLHNMLF